MRVKHKVNVVASADTDGKDKLFGLDDAAAEVVLDGFTELNSGTVQLAKDDVFDVPFAAIADGRGVFLKGTSDFTLSINGGAAITVKRGILGPASTNIATTARMLLEASVTSIQVTASVADMSLAYAVWGDPVD